MRSVIVGRTWALCLLPCVVMLASASCAGDVGLSSQPLDPTPAEQQEAADSVANADCYCRRLLLPGQTCTVTSDSLRSDALPAAPVTAIGQNACVTATGTSLETSVLIGGSVGLCSAELSYCRAHELESKARSLARPPSARVVRDTLLARARGEYLRAVTGYAGNGAVLAGVCTSSATPTVNAAAYAVLTANEAQVSANADFARECARLGTTPRFGLELSKRLADATVSLGRVGSDEVTSAIAAADGLSRSAFASDSAFLDAVWGPGGARFAALTRAAGTTPNPGALASNVEENRNRLLLPYASSVQGDRQAELALSLLERYQVPSAASGIGGSGFPKTLARFRTYLPSRDAAFLDGLVNLLDHRIAAASYVGRYSTPSPDGDALRALQSVTADELRAFAVSPLPANESPLRTSFGLTREEVLRGMDLSYDLLSTTDSDFEWRAQMSDFGGTGLVLRSTRVLQLRPRVVSPAMWQLEDTSLSQMVSDPLRGSGGLSRNNWYSRIATVPEEVGAIGALHVARVLGRQFVVAVQSRTDAAFDGSVVGKAVDGAETSIGRVWSETNRNETRGCRGVLECFIVGRRVVDTVPAVLGVPADTFRFDLYFPSDAALFTGPGTLTAYRSLDEALCVTRSARRGEEPGAACSTLFPIEARPDGFGGVSNAPTVLSGGFSRRRFLVTRTPSVTRLFFVWQATTSNEAQLVDVVDTQQSTSVHSAGGEFLSRLSDLMAKESHDPGTPSANSLGLPTGLVPPLENEITGDNQNDFEDSWRVYLASAESAQRTASARLSDARTQETDALRDVTRRQALIAQAEQGNVERLTEICGDPRMSVAGDDACNPARRPAAFTDLLPENAIIVPDDVSGLSVGTFGNTTIAFLGGITPECDAYQRSNCEAFLKDFATQFATCLPRGGGPVAQRSAYVPAYLIKGLVCTQRRTGLALRALQFPSLPVAVIDQLQVGNASADFSAYQGQVREELIKLYAQLDQFRTESLEFPNNIAAVRQQVIAAGERIDILGRNEFQIVACFGSAIASGLSDITSGAASFASIGTGLGNGVKDLTATDWQRGTIGARESVRGAGTLLTLATSGAQACGDDSNAQAAADAQAAFGGILQQMNVLTRSTQVLLSSAQVVATSDTVLSSLKRRADAAAARRDVESALATSSSFSAQPEWRATAALTRVRADEALFRAQQRAFIARRAIELRLALRMERMQRNEQFVPAPSTWVNDIYSLDTLAESGPQAGNRTIYVNRSAEELEDHVQRLTDFVDGYPFGRRFAEGRDRQVLSVGRLVPSVSLTQSTPFYRRLRYKCVNDAQVSDADAVTQLVDGRPTPCAARGGVEWAEASFSIEPELTGYVGTRLARNNFNYRLRRIVPNLVGTVILDCSALERVQQRECYSDASVQYSLRQDSSVTLENHDRELISFAMEPGVIERARALTAERLLTTPLSSADATLISAYLRQELWGRPLAGAYQIKLWPRPGIDWSRIEDIQMLVDYDYWTRQE